ncbi:MAG: hypothetical protein BroJett018_05960 [Chloroflexota bacterium]|nr:MAG: hypothetical protein BroJett018_05960 [Chloroflexota bacterium]
MCIEVPYIIDNIEHKLLVDLNVYPDNTKLQAKFEGKIFGLNTSDLESFMEKILRIFSSGIEAFEEFNWIVSGSPDITLPIIDNLPDTMELRVGRFETMGGITEFGNRFMESLIELDGLIYFLLSALDDDQ